MQLLNTLSLHLPELSSVSPHKFNSLLTSTSSNTIIAKQKILSTLYLIYQQSTLNPEVVSLEKYLIGLGTTLAAVLLDGNKYARMLERILLELERNTEISLPVNTSLHSGRDRLVGGLVTVNPNTASTGSTSKVMHKLSTMQVNEDSKMVSDAKVKDLESQLNELKAQNEQLKSQLVKSKNETKSLLIPKICDSPPSTNKLNVDHARIWQLKRQVLVYKEMASSKQEYLFSFQKEIQNCINSVDEIFMKPDTKKNNLINLKNSLQSLSKSISKRDTSSMQVPESERFIFSQDYTKEPFSILDTITGKADHLNLDRLQNLELLLHQLYVQVVKSSVDANFSTDNHINLPSILKKVLEELMLLTPLLPSRLYGKLKNQRNNHLPTTDQILPLLPKLSLAQTTKITTVLNEVFGIVEEKLNLMETNLNVLQNEIELKGNNYRELVGFIKQNLQLQGVLKENQSKCKDADLIKTRVNARVQDILHSLKNLKWTEDQVSLFLKHLERDLNSISNL